MQKIYRVLMFFVLVITAASAIAGIGAEEQFFEANENYKEENYQAALDGYLEIKASAYQSPELEYNIGNTYAKLNNYPLALLAYERALLLAPADSDLLHNRDYIADMLNVEPDIKRRGFVKVLSMIYVKLNKQNLQSVILILNIIFFILLGIRVYLAKRVPLLLLIVVALCLFITVVESSIRKQTISRMAMVINEEAEVLYEPVDGATVYFEVLPGQKVIVLRKNSDWSKISVNGNRKGWIKANMLEQLVI